MEKTPIYKIHIIVIDDDHRTTLPILTSREGERVTSSKLRGTRVVDFPSGKRCVIYLIMDFLEADPSNLIRHLNGYAMYLNGSNRIYTLALQTYITPGSPEEEKALLYFELIRQTIASSGVKRIIKDPDPKKHKLIEEGGT